MIRIAVVLSVLLPTTMMATAAMAKAWWPEPLPQLIAAHAGWPQMVSRPTLDPYGIAQTELLVDSQCKVTVQVADLQLLALLPADRLAYALVSGRDCTECDEAVTLRLVPLYRAADPALYADRWRLFFATLAGGLTSHAALPAHYYSPKNKH